MKSKYDKASPLIGQICGGVRQSAHPLYSVANRPIFSNPVKVLKRKLYLFHNASKNS